jgi:hypothetical protein
MNKPPIRYGDYVSAVRRKQRVVSYDEVYRHETEMPRAGRLRLKDVHRLLTPYVSVRFVDQLRAVAPLALLLAAFLIVVLREDVQGSHEIVIGLLAVMVGLMFFMEGVKQGLMPFAENIGYRMPGRSPVWVLLLVAFILGAAATFAEPAIGALQAAGGSIKPGSAPYLRLLLTDYAMTLVLAVALAVGLAVAAGMLRFTFGGRLKVALILTLIPALTLTWIVGNDPDLAPILGLAWDCGAITTGPVTVPLVLAVGIGVVAAAGRGNNPLSGFGVVTLASLFPAIAVMSVAIWLKAEHPELATAVSSPMATVAAWYDEPPMREVVLAMRAILPLVAFLFIVQRFVLREPLKNRDTVAYGVLTAVLGMILFNVGLVSGLVPLGDQAGAAAPTAFARPTLPGGSPLYPFVIGVGLTLLFTAALGYGSTIAEPALNAMGMTVENLSDGAFPKRLLIHAVAAGVGIGAATGVAKIIFGLPMLWLLLGGYTLALILTVLSSEEFVNLAWDSAGVTTGPVTVPLVLALGLGLAAAVGANEGFGILSMASIGPIISVQAVGLWIRYMHRVPGGRRA